MPDIDEVSYSRDETIQAIRDYYTFLTKMFVDEAAIMEPPPGGWPSITADKIGKTETVADLLRHMPYLRPNNGGTWDEIKIGPYMSPENWPEICERIQGTSRDDGDSADGEDESEVEDYGPCDTIPSHVVRLTYTYENHDEGLILLDTMLGIIHWPECMGEITTETYTKEYPDGTIVEPTLPEQIFPDAYDWVPEEEADWRASGGTWAVADFFEMMKAQFRKLNFVPSSQTECRDVWVHGYVGERDRVRAIYQEHGWPEEEESFRKEECAAAVKRVVDEMEGN